jgi:hypothetical protein
LDEDPGWKKVESGINIPDPPHWCRRLSFKEKKQGCGSGLDPDSIGSVVANPEPGEQKFLVIKTLDPDPYSAKNSGSG